MKPIHTLLRMAAAFSLACLAATAYSAGPSTITVSACGQGTFDPVAEVLSCNPSGTSLSVAGDQSCGATNGNVWLWSASSGQLTCGTPSCSIINTATNATGPFSAVAGTNITFGVSCNYFTPVLPYDWTPTGLPCAEGEAAATCTVTSATATTSPVTVQASVTDGTCGEDALHCASASPSSTVNFTAQTSSGGLPPSCSFTYYNQGNTTPLSTSLTVIGQSIPVSTDITLKPALAGANMFMAQIVVPKGTANGSHKLTYANYGGGTTSRMVYASTTPCQMTNKQLVSAGPSGGITMKVANTSGVTGSTVSMKAGDTWYVMVVDYSQDLSRGSATFGLPTKNSCNGGQSCPGLVVFQ